MKVKIFEKVYALTKEYETCSMLNKESIKKHRLRGHNFIHIGLIQVAIKPLTTKGKNSSILLGLRDARFKDFKDSIMGMLESSLHDGPVHFNCFLDFTLTLSGLHILKAVTLNIKISRAFTNMIEGSHSIALIYRIYYKCMKTNLNVNALVKSPNGQTLLIQSSNSNANVRIPKPIY